MAMGIGAALAMPIASLLMHRFDPRKVFACGVLGIAFSFYQLMRFNLQVGYWDIFLAAVHPRCFDRLSCCAAHGSDHGFHFQGEDGERHKLVQHDAEHRRELAFPWWAPC